MNVILRNSTRRMIDQSRASVEAEGFIAWLRTDGYTDYVIDCHIRRLLFVLPKLSSGTATLILSPSSAANVDRLLGSPTSRARGGFTRATCVHRGG
jgi:hypothetical protein